MTPAQSIGGGQDGNAWNPANWQITYVRDGLDEFSRIELSPTDQRYYSHTYRRDWQTGVWTRDGVLYFGEPIVLPVSHEGAKPDQIRMTSDGTVTVKVEWISLLYPSPSSVVTYNSSLAGASAFPSDATVIVKNAFNSRQSGPDLNQIYRSEGTQYRTVAINNGRGEFSFSMNATATASGPNAAVSANASDFMSTIAERIVAVPQFSNPNFYFNGQEDPSVHPHGYAQNENLDPTNIKLDVAVSHVREEDGVVKYYYYSPMLFTEYLGSWDPIGWDWPWGQGNPRTHQTNWETPPTNPAYYASWLERRITDDELTSMIEGTPLTEWLQVTGDDSRVDPRTAFLELRIHAPLEAPTVTSEEEIKGPLLCKEPVVLTPGEERSNSTTITQSWTVSESLSIGVQFELEQKLSEVFKAAIKPNASWTSTQTAALAISKTYGQNLRNLTTDNLMIITLCHRPYMMRRHLTARQYSDFGFSGIIPIRIDYFASGAPIDAEKTDAHEFPQVEYFPIN